MDIDDENGYALVEEDIISKENICYNQVLSSVGADTKHTTTSTITRESRKDSKTKFIIAFVVIVLVLSVICACTIYNMLLELSRIKSEISSSNNMISSQKMNALTPDPITLPLCCACMRGNNYYYSITNYVVSLSNAIVHYFTSTIN